MTVKHDAEKNSITAICSREGETVSLNTPIDLSQNSKINEWLRRMEREMQTTLAKMLSDSILNFSKYDAEQIKIEEYMCWIDEYPVIYIILFLFILLF
jgi:predicted metal-dependent hydrolase